MGVQVARVHTGIDGTIPDIMDIPIAEHHAGW